MSMPKWVLLRECKHRLSQKRWRSKQRLQCTLARNVRTNPSHVWIFPPSIALCRFATSRLLPAKDDRGETCHVRWHLEPTVTVGVSAQCESAGAPEMEASTDPG